MSYTVSGGWMEVVDEEYDALDEALSAARRYSDAHPDAVFNVAGDDIQAHVYAAPQEVQA